MFTLTWQYTPFMMLILLAGLQSQSGDVLEAADVDGSSALQTFRYMTLPHLRTYAELATLLGTVLMVQVFDPVNIITKGAGTPRRCPTCSTSRPSSVSRSVRRPRTASSRWW